MTYQSSPSANPEEAHSAAHHHHHRSTRLKWARPRGVEDRAPHGPCSRRLSRPQAPCSQPLHPEHRTRVQGSRSLHMLPTQHIKSSLAPAVLHSSLTPTVQSTRSRYLHIHQASGCFLQGAARVQEQCWVGHDQNLPVSTRRGASPCNLDSGTDTRTHAPERPLDTRTPVSIDHVRPRTLTRTPLSPCTDDAMRVHGPPSVPCA